MSLVLNYLHELFLKCEDIQQTVCIICFPHITIISHIAMNVETHRVATVSQRSPPSWTHCDPDKATESPLASPQQCTDRTRAPPGPAPPSHTAPGSCTPTYIRPPTAESSVLPLAQSLMFCLQILIITAC